MKTIVCIASKEFSDRFRSGWVIACVLVWLGAIALTSLFGLVQVGRIGWQGYERTVASLLSLVQYLVPLLGLLLGHDLIVSEREENTVRLVVASGVTRGQLLLGKFLGGCLALSVPLLVGFAVAGAVIGMAAHGAGLGGFCRLAASGLVLGVVFLGIGLVISIWGRSRVQALVMALLVWGGAVFVFDLVALGLMVSFHAHRDAQAIAVATGTTHVNNSADLHNAYEFGEDDAALRREGASAQFSLWLALNPVDLFRVLNLPRTLAPAVPVSVAGGAVVLWIGLCLGAGIWRIQRLDL